MSDFSGNCIKVSRGGTGDGEFREPVGIAVDKSGRLVVCDSENHRIQLFQLDSTFCCKFGGQPIFNEPLCVAVTQ